MNQEKFYEFLKGNGITEETCEKLWNENIQSPQQLASANTATISNLTTDVNLHKIHQILHKEAFPITVADDPYAKAQAVLGKHQNSNCNSTRKCDNDRPGKRNVQSDATAFYETIDGPSRREQEDSRGKYKVFQSGNEGNILNEKYSPVEIRLQDGIIAISEMSFAGSWNFRLEDTSVVKVERKTFEQKRLDDEYYPVTDGNSNRALLINISEFDNGAKARYGPDADCQQLEDVLQKLGFSITLCTNKNKSEIDQCINNFIKCSENTQASVSFVFIGSYGHREDNENYFLAKDEERIPVKDVISRFSESHCPVLRGKPKLFLFNFSSQSTDAEGKIDLADDDSLMPNADSQYEENMLISFSTAAGAKPYQDIQDGSWCVIALCKVLKERSYTDDLESILYKVNNQVVIKKDEKTFKVAVLLITFISTLKKKVRFYPQ